MMSRRTCLMTACLALAFAAPAALAQTPGWPNRPIRLVVNFPPGGITDFSARVVAPKLGELLGQPVVVENRSGSGGNIGTDYVAKAAADGYTLLLAGPPNSINVSLYPSVPFDMKRDFVPVAMLGSVPNVLVTAGRMNVRTVAEFVDYARRNPGKLNFASNGTGTTIQLAGELMKYHAKYDAQHVPFRGAPAATAALLAGEVDFMFDSLSISYQNIRAGKVRALAVTSAQRSPLLPDVPTMAESGYPQMEMGGWTGIMAPAGTAPAIVSRLEAELHRIVAMPDVIQTFEKPGMAVQFLNGPEFGQFFEREVARWAVAIRLSNARPD
jgi:tripartite-type tricarboxylate transporter receptor subunit TctC